MIKTQPKPRVTIVDADNPQRELGSIPRPGGERPNFMVLNLPTYQRPSFHRLGFDPLLDFKPTYARCEVAYRDTEGGWAKELVLKTRAPLDELARVGGFRLPGNIIPDLNDDF